MSGFGVTTVVLPYRNVKEIKKCFVGPFIPTGVKVTVFDEKKEKTRSKNYLCWEGKSGWNIFHKRQELHFKDKGKYLRNKSKNISYVLIFFKGWSF